MDDVESHLWKNPSSVENLQHGDPLTNNNILILFKYNKYIKLKNQHLETGCCEKTCIGFLAVLLMSLPLIYVDCRGEMPLARPPTSHEKKIFLWRKYNHTDTLF